jgi:hypothetical protein
MIILDIQYIESATESEVQGGCRKCWRPRGGQEDPTFKNYICPDAESIQGEFSDS